MELYHLKPHRFRNVQEMFDLFFEHYKSMLVRVEFTKDEYHWRKIDWTLSRYSRVILYASINLITISHFLLLGCQYSKWQYFNCFIENLILVKRVDILFVLLAFIFVCNDYMWLVTFTAVRRYRFRMIALLDECAKDVIITYRLRESRYLIHYFQWISLVSGIMYKIVAIIFVSWSVLTLYFYYQTFSFQSSDWFRIILLPYLLASVNFSLNHAFRLLFVMMMHIFTMIRMFKFKMARCKFYLKMTHILPGQRRMRITAFHFHYTHLFRQVWIYNDAIQQYWMAADFMIKFSVTQLLIFYTKQDRLGWFSYFIIYIFTLIFIYFNVMYAQFAYFPGQNGVCYTMLASWLARYQRRVMSDRVDLMRFVFIRFDLKTNLLTQTVSRNLLGFTSGRLYFITKFKFIEMILINFLFMSLFFKRINV